jgi:hypothetical protein
MLNSSGVLDLTFAFRLYGRLGCECQIHSTSAAFLFEVPDRISPLVVQELQIGGTSAADLKFLSVSRQVRDRNFKLKAATQINRLL